MVSAPMTMQEYEMLRDMINQQIDHEKEQGKSPSNFADAKVVEQALSDAESGEKEIWMKYLDYIKTKSFKDTEDALEDLKHEIDGTKAILESKERCKAYIKKVESTLDEIDEIQKKSTNCNEEINNIVKSAKESVKDATKYKDDADGEVLIQINKLLDGAEGEVNTIETHLTKAVDIGNKISTILDDAITLSEEIKTEYSIYDDVKRVQNPEEHESIIKNRTEAVASMLDSATEEIERVNDILSNAKKNMSDIEDLIYQIKKLHEGDNSPDGPLRVVTGSFASKKCRFEIINKDTTLIELLIDKLNNNPDVSYARYIVDHPDLTLPMLEIVMEKGSVKNALKKAIDDVKTYFMNTADKN